MAIGEELGLQVNAKAAGKGKVSCVVVQPDGSEVEAEVVENEDGTFDIFYTAPAPGSYVIYVRFGGENIPRSPFKVMVSRQLLGLCLECRICLAVRGKQAAHVSSIRSLLTSRFYQLSQQSRRLCVIMPGSNPAGLAANVY